MVTSRSGRRTGRRGNARGRAGSVAAGVSKLGSRQASHRGRRSAGGRGHRSGAESTRGKQRWGLPWENGRGGPRGDRGGSGARPFRAREGATRGAAAVPVRVDSPPWCGSGAAGSSSIKAEQPSQPGRASTSSRPLGLQVQVEHFAWSSHFDARRRLDQASRLSDSRTRWVELLELGTAPAHISHERSRRSTYRSPTSPGITGPVLQGRTRCSLTDP